MKNKLFWLSCVTGVAMFISTASADVPVEDLSQGYNPDGTSATASAPTNDENSASSATVSGTVSPQTNADTENPPPVSLSSDQRINRLEQQMANIANMNLPQQMSDLQQQLAQVRGQLQVQSHDLKLLNDQQRSFYQDLDQRINKLNQFSGSSGNSNPPATKSPATNKVPASTENSTLLKDSGAFQEGFDFLTQKKYDQAKASFQYYLKEFPNGNYVANAHYWLGEIYFQQSDNAKAADQFDTIVKQFPKSEKLPDAKLKLAIIDATQGRVEQARQELQQIKKQHPGTTAAQLASIRLQQLDTSHSASRSQ